MKYDTQTNEQEGRENHDGEAQGCVGGERSKGSGGPFKKEEECGVYAFRCILDGRFYVGSSKRMTARRKAHLWEVRSGSQNFFHRSVRKIGCENFVFGVIEHCAEKERFDRELFWIEKLGSAKAGFNTVQNPTARQFYVISDATLRRMSAATKAQFSTPEARAAQSVRAKAYFSIPEVRTAQSARAKAFQSRPESRAANAARAKAQFSTPESRAAASARTKAFQNTPEARAANSIRMKELLSNPIVREKAVAKLLDYNRSELGREYKSEIAKKRFSTQEARAQHGEFIKASVSKPEARFENSKRLTLFSKTEKGRQHLLKIRSERDAFLLTDAGIAEMKAHSEKLKGFYKTETGRNLLLSMSKNRKAFYDSEIGMAKKASMSKKRRATWALKRATKLSQETLLLGIPPSE